MKRLAPFALVGVLSLTRLSTPHAEPAPPRLTLEEALALLERQNPDRRAAMLEVAEAEAERVAARVYPNPSLNVDIANLPVGRRNPPGLSIRDSVTSTYRIDQPLVLWGKRRLRVESAEAGVEAAGRRERATVLELRSAVKDAFFAALHDRGLVSFATDNQRRYQQTIDLNDRRFRAGDVSEAEFRTIELENLRYLAAVEEAGKQLNQSQERLGRLVGAGRAVEPTGSPDTPDVELSRDQLLTTAMVERSDLSALEQERRQKDVDLRLARRERFPDVTFGADYTNNQFLVGGNNKNTLGFGFSVPLPLFDRNQGDIAKAEVALGRSENEIARLKLDIAEQVHDAADAYESAMRHRRAFEGGALDHAKLTLHAAESTYRRGGSSLIELLDAERTYTATQTDYLDAVFAARAALIAVERAVGTESVAPSR